jgi:hypothetical protein
MLSHRTRWRKRFFVFNWCDTPPRRCDNDDEEEEDAEVDEEEEAEDADEENTRVRAGWSSEDGESSGLSSPPTSDIDDSAEAPPAPPSLKKVRRDPPMRDPGTSDRALRPQTSRPKK